MKELIKVSSSDFSGKERKYLNDCLSRNWLSQGKYVREFEEKFAEYVQAKYAIACSSGTAALHLACLALGMVEDDNVIVPALTYVATANAARYCGACVRFSDVDPDNWCLSEKTVLKEERTTKSIDFVIASELYDSITGLDPFFLESCNVIYDCCETLSPLGNRRVSTYSFYGNKIISCGEGGMLVTNCPALAGRTRLYRGQGATTTGKYHHSVIGYNYRMTDMQAAVGLAQLEQILEKLAIRRSIVDRYRKNLHFYQGLITLQGGERASGWIMAVLLPDTEKVHVASRDSIAEILLRDFNIETRPFFEPITSLPMYKGEVPPVAADVSKRGLCLPTHERLSNSDVDYVCESLLSALEIK